MTFVDFDICYRKVSLQKLRCDHDQYFRFQMFKTGEIRLFLYVARELKL